MSPSRAPHEPDVELLLGRYADERMAAAPGQVANGRARLLSSFVLRDARATQAAGKGRRLRGWSLAAVMAALALGISGLVAAESGPGQPFYGLRLAIGSVTLPRDEPAHEQGLADQLEDRLTEVRAAARNGDGHGVLAAINEYLRTLDELTTTGITDPAILTLLQHHQDTLEELLTVAPEQATNGLQQAFDKAGSVNLGSPPAQTTAAHPTPAQGTDGSPPPTGKP